VHPPRPLPGRRGWKCRQRPGRQARVPLRPRRLRPQGRRPRPPDAPPPPAGPPPPPPPASPPPPPPPPPPKPPPPARPPPPAAAPPPPAPAAPAGGTPPSARSAARPDEPDPRGRRTGRPPSPRTAAARPPTEELVQDVGQVGRLRVLDVVDEGLPPGALLGRDIEQAKPAVDLVEEGGIEGHDDDGAQARQRHDVDPALSVTGRRHAVGCEHAEDLVGEILRVGVLHLEDARAQVVEGVCVEGVGQLAQARDVRLQVGHDEEVGPIVGEHVAARRDERLQDVHHVAGGDMLQRQDLDHEAILRPRLRLRRLALRYDGTRLCLGDGKDLIDVADLHR